MHVVKNHTQPIAVLFFLVSFAHDSVEELAVGLKMT